MYVFPQKSLRSSLLITETHTDNPQRLGMMTLLGQHGQALDYERGIGLIKYAASSADENAPQGAYVKLNPSIRGTANMAARSWGCCSPGN